MEGNILCSKLKVISIIKYKLMAKNNKPISFLVTSCNFLIYIYIYNITLYNIMVFFKTGRLELTIYSVGIRGLLPEQPHVVLIFLLMK